MSDLSIVISSCDKYSYLWDIQLQFFNRYWPKCPYDIYYISEYSDVPLMDTKLKLNSVNIKNVSNGPEDWSFMLETALKKINTKYIIYMQEDYILTDVIKQKNVDILIDYIKSNNINYIRFYTGPPGNGESIKVTNELSIKEIKPGTKWRGNLMLAIWKRETLLSLIESKSITPWQFEHLSTDSFDKFYCIDLPTYDSSGVLPFLGMYGSSNGFSIYPIIVELLEKEGIKKLDGSEINYNIKL
jgi:hypothetical protein